MMDSPRWLDTEQQAAWQDLLTVAIGLPALLDRQLERDADISNFEYSVLARLSMAPQLTMRLSELASHCNSTLPRLSKLMARFEKREWIARSVDPSDGRYTLAQLTDAGMEKVVGSAPGHVENVQRLVFDPLTVEQEGQLATSLAPIAAMVRDQLNLR